MKRKEALKEECSSTRLVPLDGEGAVYFDKATGLTFTADRTKSEAEKFTLLQQERKGRIEKIATIQYLAAGDDLDTPVTAIVNNRIDHE